jgi:hypothetical protein
VKNEVQASGAIVAERAMEWPVRCSIRARTISFVPGILTEEEAWKILAYMRSFCEKR